MNFFEASCVLNSLCGLVAGVIGARDATWGWIAVGAALGFSIGFAIYVLAVVVPTELAFRRPADRIANGLCRFAFASACAGPLLAGLLSVNVIALLCRV